ncbi:hypothetical protein FQR65_LT16534 [Abscondita terminalis]|nr:hypothetical protein FQR65_LT16534 [Abscondita terminalis]
MICTTTKGVVKPYKLNRRWKNTIDSETLKITNASTIKNCVPTTPSDPEIGMSTINDTHPDTKAGEIYKSTKACKLTQSSNVGHRIEDDSDLSNQETESSDFEIEYETDKHNSQSQQNFHISGRRIINISYFFQQLKNISHKGGYEIRCKAAAVSYNTKGDFLWRLQNKLFGCNDQPQHLLQFREKKLKAAKATTKRRFPKQNY